VEAAARGQEVFFNAWGGDPNRNAYIEWAAGEVLDRHGVTVTHVKLADTGEAVARVVAERAAGRDEVGAVDLIWINGPNFASMKAQNLLFGPWAEDLPNWAYVDVSGKPTVQIDFTIPTQGFEAPWGMAQIVFYHDSARLPDPPRDMAGLGKWAAANPGRFAYPMPPDFLGLTFLKQAAVALIEDPAILQAPVDETRYHEQSAPLWAWLGRSFSLCVRASGALVSTSTIRRIPTVIGLPGGAAKGFRA
jgi:putative thiamine transport system substrate-binding protein